MGNAMHSAHAAPGCGAYARTTGRACKSPAMKNGRCRMHGGKPGRKPKHGLYTREATERRRKVRAIVWDGAGLVAGVA